jgi:hypothetical protein
MEDNFDSAYCDCTEGIGQSFIAYANLSGTPCRQAGRRANKNAYCRVFAKCARVVVRFAGK